MSPLCLSSVRFGSRVAALALFGAVSLGAVASADTNEPGVARIDVIRGNVDVRRADSGDTVAAAVNAPLDAGDYLTTGKEARAELELTGRAALRVGPQTQLRFTTIDSAATAAQLAQGELELRLFRGAATHPEIDTPGATIRPDASGAYRVDVDAAGATTIDVRSGSASVIAGSTTRELAAGDVVRIGSDGALAESASVVLAPADGFDAWNRERDRAEASARSYAYLDDQIVGGSDLDAYGSWSNVGNYGYSWRPNYVAGWSPYSDGRWAWEPYYGWTWVAAEPWGWAPYHYGRWFYTNASWYWTPQLAYAVPVYRPALVAFFSFGGGFGSGLGIGIGNVGWVPLAPYEAFHPWWGAGYGGYGVGNGFGGYLGGYAYGRNAITNVTNVNVTNVNNGTINRISRFGNAGAPGGLIAVRSAAFGQSTISANRIPLTAAEVRTAGIAPIRGVVPVVPDRQSLAYGERSAQPNHLAADRFAAVRGNLTSPVPIRNFAEQRAAVEFATRREFTTLARPGTTSLANPAAGSAAAAAAEARRMDVRSGSGRTFTTTRPASTGPSAFDRFGATRDSATRVVVPEAPAVRSEPAGVRTEPQRFVPRTYGATGAAWQRFDLGAGVRAPASTSGSATRRFPTASTMFGTAPGTRAIAPARISIPAVAPGSTGISRPATIERTSPVERGMRSEAPPSGSRAGAGGAGQHAGAAGPGAGFGSAGGFGGGFGAGGAGAHGPGR